MINNVRQLSSKRKAKGRYGDEEVACLSIYFTIDELKFIKAQCFDGRKRHQYMTHYIRVLVQKEMGKK